MPLSAPVHMQMAYGVKLVSAFFPFVLLLGVGSYQGISMG